MKVPEYQLQCWFLWIPVQNKHNSKHMQVATNI